MEHFYTSERNAQIVISLLKEYGIRKVIASPGTTNICLVASMQQDSFFEIYSAADERSAGYIACGMAAESGEAVVLSCTGATASRNYMSALTEAFYRKLPILAITSSRRSYRIGHNFDQVTDRTQLPKDVAKLSVQVPLVYDKESEWADIIAVNKALLELDHHGKGPVHINLETNYNTDYSIKNLLPVRVIRRINYEDKFPLVNAQKIIIMVGAHVKWSKELVKAVERFCEIYNAVVLCDHISNYKGKYRLFANLVSQQKYYNAVLKQADLMIHIGDITASNYDVSVKSVWRVHPDGELRDTYGKLQFVFEMSEEYFFRHYYSDNNKLNTSFYKECKKEELEAEKHLKDIVKKLPFSNAWIASQTTGILPSNAVLHFGIQNSLRFWNFFDVSETILGYCNTGGFGIDGNISSAIGASLTNNDHIYFCILGDLAFFYDINSLGNKHIGKNIRILLVNNGEGAEFKLFGNPGYLFGAETDKYIAASGHYGNKSHSLVKHYAQDLGFEYMYAETKAEYLAVAEYFVNPNNMDKPIILEVFTNSSDERNALDLIKGCVVDEKILRERKSKQAVKVILGEKNVEKIKKIIKK